MNQNKDNNLSKTEKLIYVLAHLEKAEHNPDKIKKFRKMKEKLINFQENKDINKN